MWIMVLTGREKATILLSLLGSELSSQILQNLPEEFADLIAAGVNNLPTPSSNVIASVLDEFASFMALPAAPPRRVIEESSRPPSITTPPAEPKRSPYDILFYSPPRKVAVALSAERSYVTAYVLSILPPVQAAEVMTFMSERRKEIETIMRNLKKPPVSEQIKDRIVEILSDRLERLAFDR